MKKYFAQRSAVIDYQRCPRLRYLGYAYNGRGLEPQRKPLPLCVGGAVHRGLEYLLREGGRQWDQDGTLTAPMTLEDAAVEMALVEFAQESAGGLELDVTELAAQQPVATLGSQLVESAFEFGLPQDDPALVALKQDVASAGAKFDKYLADEQRALVEAMVRAYSRRRLRPLLQQFQVLEVEREGEWLLAEWDYTLEDNPSDPDPYRNAERTGELWFLSRPDALLLDRESRELYLLSYKTTATWDTRKEKDAAIDLQGLTEGIEVEQRMARWWEALHVEGDTHEPISTEVRKYLVSIPAPPRVHAIRYEFLLKGSRYVDKELTERVGFEARSQASSLVRGYLNKGMTAADAQWCCEYKFVKEDGSGSNLYYKNWPARPVWEHMPVKQWIDLMDDSREVPTATGGVVWQSAAQASGFLREHPLDSQFVSPIVVYRNSDDLYDLVDTLEAQEVRIAQAVELVNAATDEGERRHLLNANFGMNRSACVYPTQCRMFPLCHGATEIRQHPLENGYRTRVPNHPQEDLTNISHEDTVCE